MQLTEFPTDPGTYLLLMRLNTSITMQIGKLGEFAFAAGEYAYVGSAHGPGGLRARLTRHLRAEKALHWHIDYLTVYAPVAAVWWLSSPERLECDWAQIVQAQPGISVPVARFGASDCRCPAHLFMLPSDTLAGLRAALSNPTITNVKP